MAYGSDRPRSGGFGGSRSGGGGSRSGGFRGGSRGGGGGGSFRSGPRRGGFDRGPREMHKATCAQCGKECEVPFVPKEDRPVYCKECYLKQKGIEPRESRAPAPSASNESDDFDDDSDEE